MNRIYATLKQIHDAGAALAMAPPASAKKDEDLKAGFRNLRECFCEAMDDDFNTARAMGHLFDAVRLINAALAEKRPVFSHGVLIEAGKILLEIGSVLGLILQKPGDYLRQDREREALKRGLCVEEIERLILERRDARTAKMWQRADEIRDTLAAQGVILKDGPDATTWTIA
jgi:cysteinyl-tRNA synthetase